MSGAGEQAFTLKKNASNMILCWQIEEFFQSFISLIPPKNNSRKGLKFRRVKDHSIV
jgi:hypothetical protein